MHICRVLFGLLILVIQPISTAQIVGDRLRVTTTEGRFDGYVTAIDSTGIVIYGMMVHTWYPMPISYFLSDL